MDINLKRRIIQFGAIPGVISILLIWGIELWLDRDIASLDRIMLPVLAILFGSISLLFWQRKIAERQFDFLVYSIFILYAVTKFESSLAIAYQTNGYFSTNFLVWLPFFFILGFMLLDMQNALIASIVSFTILLGIGIYYLVQLSRTGGKIGNFSLLFQVYIASALYIFVAYLLSRFRARYYAARTIAQTMSELARTDPLTEVYNRRTLDEAVQEGLRQYKITGNPFSVILFDLDHFKGINDLRGHAAGDLILKQVAQLIQENIRKRDMFGRWGGDEFLYVAFDTDAQGAFELADRLRTILASANISNMITASFGIAVSQENDLSESLISHADEALYKAKAMGKNRIEIYDNEK